MSKIRQNLLKKINDLRYKQDKKYGYNESKSNLEWHALVSEEFGEVGHEVCDFHFNDDGCIDNLKEEIIQTISICLAWLESIEKGIINE